MKEEWRVIEECPLYEVSNRGEVRRIKSGRLLKAHRFFAPRNPLPKLRVHLWTGEKIQTCMVHRLVAAAFIPNPDNLPWVRHINGNHLDNRVQNLAWGEKCYASRGNKKD